MDPEGSLPYSKKPLTWPHPVPGESVHTLSSYSSRINFNIILTSAPRYSKWEYIYFPEMFFAIWYTPLAYLFIYAGKGKGKVVPELLL